MQRLIFEFQKTCDNNLSFEAFKNKIDNQIKTFERQKSTLDSLLGFENTRKIQEKKKREEVKAKKEEQERKKKEEEERQKRKEEKIKKKKEEERKKKEEEEAAKNQANNTNNPNPVAAVTAVPQPLSITLATPSSNQPAAATAPQSEQQTASQKGNSNTLKGKEGNNITGNEIKKEKRDFLDIEPEEKLDISEGSIRSKEVQEKDKDKDGKAEEKSKASEGDVSKEDTNSKKDADKEGKDEKKDSEKKDGVDDKKDDKKKKDENIGDPIMKNEDYDVFKRFNIMAGEELVPVPEIFLIDEQMKIERQKAMNSVISLEVEYLDSLQYYLQDAKNKFDHFSKLIENIDKIEEKIQRIAKNNNNYLVVSEEEVIDFIKEYLLSNQIAGEFLNMGDEQIRSSPFFEDFQGRVISYMEALTQMLKSRFYAFAELQDSSLTVNFGQLKEALNKFATLNLTSILGEVYGDLNQKIMKFMVGQDSLQLLLETQSDNQLSKTFNRLDEADEGLQITEKSTPEEIKEYLNVLQNNSEKYFKVLQDISKIVEATPLETKLEELQDTLETRMEGVMKQFPSHFLKQSVLDALQKFDSTMNALSESFLFDMKGMAENIESSTLEDSLRQSLLSLKNQMYTQMQALRESQDEEDYNILQELVLFHFLQISKQTQLAIEQKKKASSHKKGCLEIIIMNYQLFTTLIELFDTDIEKKTQTHYSVISSTTRAVKEYFLTFLDLDIVVQDHPLLKKALETYSELSLLECELSDKLHDLS